MTGMVEAHGRCPKCGEDWDAGFAVSRLLPLALLDDPGRAVAYRCPGCGETWDRTQVAWPSNEGGERG